MVCWVASAFLKFFIIFILFFKCSIANDLFSLQKEALINDAIYSSSKAEFIAIQEQINQAKSKLLPQANLGVNSEWNNIYFNSNSSSFTRNYGKHSLGVIVSKSLYNAADRKSLEIANLEVEKAFISLKIIEQDLTLKVARKYFDVLLNKENLITVKSQKLAVRKQLEQAKRNFIVGTATITDQREAKASYDLVQAREIEATNKLEIAKSSLALVVGKEIIQSFKRMNLPLSLKKIEPNDVNYWIQLAISNNLNVKKSRKNIELFKKNVELQKTGHQPTLDLIGSHTFSDQGFSSFGNYNAQTSILGLNFNFPLFDGGLVNSKVKQALAYQQKSLKDLEVEKRISIQNTRESFFTFNSGLAQITALEQAVASTMLQLESTRLGQEVGVRTSVDVLDAEQKLVGAKNELYKAVYNTLYSKLQLLATTGKLSNKDIKDVGNLIIQNGAKE